VTGSRCAKSTRATARACVARQLAVGAPRRPNNRDTSVRILSTLRDESRLLVMDLRQAHYDDSHGRVTVATEELGLVTRAPGHPGPGQGPGQSRVGAPTPGSGVGGLRAPTQYRRGRSVTVTVTGRGPGPARLRVTAARAAAAAAARCHAGWATRRSDGCSRSEIF
jgi:hypothetical protein